MLDDSSADLRLVPAVDVKLGIVLGSVIEPVLHVDGQPWPSAPWPAGYAPSPGDTMKVLTVNGQVAMVWPFTNTPQPLLGDVMAGGAPAPGRINVVGVDSRLYQARYEGAAPSAGTRVLILWPGKDPFVRDLAVPATAEDPDPPSGPTPPGGPSTGTTTLIPTAAGTWRSTWSRWEPGDVVQGTWAGSPYRGAWFYGDAGTVLAGRTITKIVMTVGPRASRGNHNDTQSAHFYVASGGAPNNWSALTSVHNVTVTGAWKDGERSFELPASWGALLAAGHGIGIAGDPYLGFGGNAPSGRLVITWRK